MKYVQDLSDNQEEYYFLELSLTNQLYNKYVDKVNTQIEKNKKDGNDLLKDILLILASIEDILKIDNEKLFKIKDQIQKDVDFYIENQKKKEIANYENLLKNVAKEEFKINNYLQSIGLEDFKIQEISQKEIENILNFKIDNKTFKDRIENNKDNIKQIILANIALFLEGEDTQDKLVKELTKNLELNNFMSERLGNNEIMRTIVSSSELWKNKVGIEKEMYCSVLESTTCLECSSLHGKIYDVNDSSKPKLPRHVHCKCSYITITSDLWINKKEKSISLEDIEKEEL